MEHVLLVALGGDEPVDLHLLRLPDAVAARLRLNVVLGVPVAVLGVVTWCDSGGWVSVN